jgi:hypothetical protein
MFSNYVSYDSPDGLPTNPWPQKAVPTICKECYNETDTEVCKSCGAENEIEYETDYEIDYDE